MFFRSVPVFLVAQILALHAAQPAFAHDKEEGTVVKAGEGKVILTAKGQQKQVTREVAKDAPVTLDGKPAKLEDLKEGFHVAVALGPKHLVIKIEAHSKAREVAKDAPMTLNGKPAQEKKETTTKGTIFRAKEAKKGDEHAKHAEAKTAGHKGDEHGKHHDHRNHGHKTGEHKGHKAGGHHGNEIAPEGKVKIGDKVPDFAVRTLDGKSVRLRGYPRSEFTLQVCI